MILLDTHALIWLQGGHARAKKLARTSGRLALSPVVLLEVQLLVELGRLRLKTTLTDLADDPRWTVDEPPARAWFEQSCALSWTRDPFDRLVVAHALTRSWKLATADENILEHIDHCNVFEL